MQPVATRRLEAEQTAEIAYAVSRTRALGRPDLAELLEAGEISAMEAFIRLHTRP